MRSPFSPALSTPRSLIAYIEGQMEHHRTRSFQEEYHAFLTKYGIEFDERYVWD